MSSQFRKTVTTSKNLNNVCASAKCKYLNDRELKVLQLHGTVLYVLHLNIRSFCKNGDNLLHLLDDLAQQEIVYDVIMLCETYLNEKSIQYANIQGITGYHNAR